MSKKVLKQSKVNLVLCIANISFFIILAVCIAIISGSFNDLVKADEHWQFKIAKVISTGFVYPFLGKTLNCCGFDY